MNDEEFKKKLTEVCDWEIPIIGLNGGPAKPRLRQTHIEVVIDEFGEEQEIEIIDGDNPTVAPKIKKIFPITKPCEYCGELVKDRKVTYRLYFGTKSNDRGVWKIKCTHCRMHKNPWTGDFNIEPEQVGRVYQEYINEDPNGDSDQINRSDSIFVALKTPLAK